MTLLRNFTTTDTLTGYKNHNDENFVCDLIGYANSRTIRSIITESNNVKYLFKIHDMGYDNGTLIKKLTLLHYSICDQHGMDGSNQRVTDCSHISFGYECAKLVESSRGKLALANSNLSIIAGSNDFHVWYEYIKMGVDSKKLFEIPDIRHFEFIFTLKGEVIDDNHARYLLQTKFSTRPEVLSRVNIIHIKDPTTLREYIRGRYLSFKDISVWFFQDKLDLVPASFILKCYGKTGFHLDVDNFICLNKVVKNVRFITNKDDALHYLRCNTY